MNVADPYKTLQVDPEAEDEVIEAAYRRLARKYHPDVAPGPEAQDRMVRINQAWEMLRDPIRRAAVDRARVRTAGSAARAAAAEARERAATQAARGGRYDPPHGATQPSAGAGPSWGIPGMVDPTSGDFRANPQRVSPDWSTGRSHQGYGYDPGTMGTAQGDGSAGPPPGNPSGSVLNFGRYTGWSLGEIARTDLEYLEWLDRMPIGRAYQPEIDALLRAKGRRRAAPDPRSADQRGLFRRR